MKSFSELSGIILCLSIKDYGPEYTTLKRYLRFFKKIMNSDGISHSQFFLIKKEMKLMPIAVILFSNQADEKVVKLNGMPTLRFTTKSSMFFKLKIKLKSI